MALQFFNTMGRKLEAFSPVSSGEARLYTCGPTVYNFAHIGNFRAYIFEDLLRRVLKYTGYRVVQVMNLTDVDDKTIRNSIAAGIPLRDFTAKYKQEFFSDLKTLAIEPAEFYPAATDHIPEMIALVQALMDKGYAYRAEDNSIYFSIAKFPEYGKLARIDMENQRAGVRIKTDEYAKDAVADFALWKSWDENDGDVWWDSPWGKGRPGWHIECSAMSMKYLGKTFDIHTGGVDNMFPHHEDEIAQSESANGCRYVNYWLHCDHLIVNGEKMSKSAGNFFTLRDLISRGFSGNELRWVLLGTHYRKKLNFSFDACEQARTVLKKFNELFIRLKSASGANGNEEEIKQFTAKCQNDFANALNDDLNIAEAIAAVFALQHEANRLLDANTLSPAGAEIIKAQFRDFNRIFAVFNPDEAIGETAPDAVIALADERLQARKNKNFARSDELREAIKQLGWVVEDAPGGYRLKPV
jgi:cysteinyl-tRNA synthetase